MRGRAVVVVCLTAAASAAVACSLVVDTKGLAGGADGPDAADAGIADAPGDAPPRVVDADASRCPDAGVDPTLVVYLPFDEAAGATAFDCSGRGHDGQVLGANPTRMPGHSGSALAFDGTETCVALGMPADLVLKGSFTVASWARVDVYQTAPPDNDSRAILSKTTAPTSMGWRFVTLVSGPITEMGFKIGQSNGTTFTVPSPGPQPLSTWIHFAGVWVPGDHAELFVNGVSVKRTTTIPSILEDADASVFAGCIRPGTQHFKGALDELRIYARALPQAEIAELAR